MNQKKQNNRSNLGAGTREFNEPPEMFWCISFSVRSITDTLLTCVLTSYSPEQRKEEFGTACKMVNRSETLPRLKLKRRLESHRAWRRWRWVPRCSAWWGGWWPSDTAPLSSALRSRWSPEPRWRTGRPTWTTWREKESEKEFLFEGSFSFILFQGQLWASGRLDGKSSFKCFWRLVNPS